MTHMAPSRDEGRGVGAIAIIAGINLVIGFIGYFIAFVFAYGFRDEIGTTEHMLFLILIAILTAICASVSTLVIKAALNLTFRGAAALAFSASAAANLGAVGLGSIVSATHKDEGSVSADFSTTTDMLVAAGLFAAALVAAWVAWRSLPRRSVS